MDKDVPWRRLGSGTRCVRHVLTDVLGAGVQCGHVFRHTTKALLRHIASYAVRTCAHTFFVKRDLQFVALEIHVERKRFRKLGPSTPKEVDGG